MRNIEYTNINKSVKMAGSITLKKAVEICIYRFISEKLPSIIYLGLLFFFAFIAKLFDTPLFIIFLILGTRSFLNLEITHKKRGIICL